MFLSCKKLEADVVARSNAEPDYRAMEMVTCELTWVKQLLNELKFGSVDQMKPFCENQAASSFCTKSIISWKNKPYTNELPPN